MIYKTFCQIAGNLAKMIYNKFWTIWHWETRKLYDLANKRLHKRIWAWDPELLTELGCIRA